MKRTPRELGVTGLRHINNTLIDSEIQEQLRFPQSIRTFAKMESDPIISGSLTLINQFIKKAPAEIIPAGGVEATDGAKARSETIKDLLFKKMDRSFEEVVSDAVSFVKNGFAFHEPTYRIREGMITWKDFPCRHASTIKGFKFKENGDIETVYQWRPNVFGYVPNENMAGTEIPIPYDRLLHFRASTEMNNPVGRSILKNAFMSWFYKRNLEETEAIGVEKDLNGIPYLSVPSEYFTADPEEDPEMWEQQQEFIRVLESMRRNEQAGLLLPSDRDENGHKRFEMELLSAKGTRAIDTSKIIERHDYRMAQSMLTDFLLMGSSSSGSFALSDNKVSTFVQSLESYLQVIADQFNRKAIPWLFELNKWDKSEMPTLKFKPISSASLTEIANLFDKAKGFITPGEDVENNLRAEIGWADRDSSKSYLDKPTPAHQAVSQRIGMTNKASPNQDNSNEDDNKEEAPLNE